MEWILGSLCTLLCIGATVGVYGIYNSRKTLPLQKNERIKALFNNDNYCGLEVKIRNNALFFDINVLLSNEIVKSILKKKDSPLYNELINLPITANGNYLYNLRFKITNQNKLFMIVNGVSNRNVRRESVELHKLSYIVSALNDCANSDEKINKDRYFQEKFKAINDILKEMSEDNSNLYTQMKKRLSELNVLKKSRNNACEVDKYYSVINANTAEYNLYVMSDECKRLKITE